MTTLDTPTLLDAGTWSGQVFDGRWRQAEGGDAPVTEPATGDELARIGIASPGGRRRVGHRRRRGAARVGARPPTRSAPRCCARAGDLFVAHAAEIEGWIMRESGGDPAEGAARDPRRRSRSATRRPRCRRARWGELLRHRAKPRLSLARRLPVGVVGVIAPFNFPLILAIRSVAPALALGNAVVLKPDPRTAVCGGVVDRPRVRGGRAARRRAARPAGRRRRRPGAGRGARGAGHLLHRLDRRRAARSARPAGAAAQARPPRAGRQLGADRARGRRPRRARSAPPRSAPSSTRARSA